MKDGDDADVGAGRRWVSCRPGFFLPVRLLLQGLQAAFAAGELSFFSNLARLEDPDA